MALCEVLYKNQPLRLSYELGGFFASKNEASNELDCDKNEASNEGSLLLVLHGWGADKTLLKPLAKSICNKINARYLLLDLPGFGQSQEPNFAFSSIHYQEVIELFLLKLKLEPSMLLGHSFGGKLACMLAAKGSVKMLAILSASGLPQKKRLSVKLKIKATKALKALGLGALGSIFKSKDAKGQSALMYEVLKRVVDEDLSLLLPKVKAQKTLVFWGEKDEAVSLSSGELFAKLIPNASFKALAGDHFFFLNQEELVAKAFAQGFLDLEQS